MKFKHPRAHNLLINEIRSLSDKAHQEKTWVRQQGPEVWSYSEAQNGFHDGWPYGIEENYKDFGLTDTQLKSLLRLKKAMENYDEPDAYVDRSSKRYRDPKFILEDPNWDKVIEIAKQTYDILKDGPRAYDDGPFKCRELNAIVREDLRYLSDKDYQEITWVKSEGDIYDCLEDTIELFLSRWPVNIDQKYKEYGLTTEQYQKLKELYQKIKNYKQPKTDKEALQDPKWLEIIEFAKSLFKEFNKQSGFKKLKRSFDKQ